MFEIEICGAMGDARDLYNKKFEDYSESKNTIERELIKIEKKSKKQPGHQLFDEKTIERN